MPRRTTVALPALTLVAVLGVLLGGCARWERDAGPAAPSPQPVATSAFPSHGGFNPTDVMFLQMMVPHHRQGLEIVRLAERRTTNAEIRTLAIAINATQTQEIEAMAGWLRAWNQPPTADPKEHAAHGGMPGTDSVEIADVARRTDAEFDRALLNLLIAHQDDAVQLASMETASGVNSAVRTLAQQISVSRRAQITQMLALHG